MLIVFLMTHQNSRYQASLEQLTRAELELTLRAAGVQAQVQTRSYVGNVALCVDAPVHDELLNRLLGRMSGLYMACREGDDGALYPVAGRAEAYLGQDLSGILKYKGKTSETFTRFLLNMARLSGRWAQEDAPLDVLDPVCGRGTTLLEALNAGDNAFGVDVDAKALDELKTFLKRYMTYHHLKHAIDARSLTVDGAPRPLWQISTARTPEEYKAHDVRSLSLVQCDTLLLDKLLARRKFHIIAGDLPYGVQHATHSGDSRTAFKPGAAGRAGAHERVKAVTIEQFTAEAVPVWARLLAPGGVLALSFNSYTLKRDALREQMCACGLEVCQGGAYDGMEHWVEQAVKRDLAIAVKPL